MIAIIDYGMGNLRSVQKALQLLGFEAQIMSKPQDVLTADKVILPGVGAFADAIAALNDCDGMVDAIEETLKDGKPILGICLGMQLIMSISYEMGTWQGLDLIKGDVQCFPKDMGLKVPHIGWNKLVDISGSLFADLPDVPYVYFVHSYYCTPQNEDDIAASCEYGIKFCASIEKDNIYATQFHPEKSGDVGLKILENFGNL